MLDLAAIIYQNLTEAERAIADAKIEQHRRDEEERAGYRKTIIGRTELFSNSIPTAKPKPVVKLTAEEVYADRAAAQAAIEDWNDFVANCLTAEQPINNWLNPVRRGPSLPDEARRIDQAPCEDEDFIEGEYPTACSDCKHKDCPLSPYYEEPGVLGQLSRERREA